MCMATRGAKRKTYRWDTDYKKRRKTAKTVMVPMQIESTMAAPQSSRGWIKADTVEFKYKDTSSAVANASTGNLYIMNGIAKGDGVSERIGRKVTVRSIQLRGYLATNTVTATMDVVRVIIFVDRQVNAVAPTVAEVLQTATFEQFRNLENRARFRILFSKAYAVGNQYCQSYVPIDWYKKISIPTIYSGTGATSASITTNGLYILLICEEATNPSRHSLRWRVRYTDD